MLSAPTTIGAAKICPSVRWLLTTNHQDDITRSIDRGALRDGAVDADAGLPAAQPKIKAGHQDEMVRMSRIAQMIFSGMPP